ncbi:hypothetical protein [Desulfopila sp. IMCC35008]|uniref:hypothetical protein n=1 Tax=Desulfopila sp. IMCC35008 TaxID=2653858 RepID=UPI0013D4B3D7|nr:hypothetical protein [Desulfopila sp. IMCC35008]
MPARNFITGQANLSLFLSPEFYKPTLTILALILVLCLIFLFRRKNNRLSAKLLSTETNLLNTQQELLELRQKLDSTLEFQKSLHEAEITTRLQQPRLEVQHANSSVKAPERYHYIKSLSEKGMGAEEIANILSISAHEASQLVTLSRLVASPS